jgi:pimeloyl-ACP methyl ester carboxylesterase
VKTTAGTGIARYYGNGSLEGDASATRAIVIVHGVLRNADTYFATGEAMLAAAHAGRTLLIAPQFVEQSDLKGQHVPAATLRWSDQWPGGAAATAPAPISTYAVFDAIVARLADRSLFPLLRQVVIIGHSAGGQIVQRYAVVGKGPDLVAEHGLGVHIVVANPSSYLYFDRWRPVRERNCPDVDHWRYGFVGAPPYVQGSAAALEHRYVGRDVTYLLGTADTDAHEWDLDKSCGGEAQGPFRFARGKAYIGYIHSRHSAGTSQDYAYVGGVGHDNLKMFTSACGIAVVFDRSRVPCVHSGKI